MVVDMASMVQSSLLGSTAKLVATPRRTPRASARPVVARADAKFQEQLPGTYLQLVARGGNSVQLARFWAWWGAL